MKKLILLGVRDISSEPLSSDSVEKVVGQPATVETDSKASVEVLRPAARRFFARLSPDQKKSPSLLTGTVYHKLLGIDLDDPYLGLLGSKLPGVD